VPGVLAVSRHFKIVVITIVTINSQKSAYIKTIVITIVTINSPKSVPWCNCCISPFVEDF